MLHNKAQMYLNHRALFLFANTEKSTPSLFASPLHHSSLLSLHPSLQIRVSGVSVVFTLGVSYVYGGLSKRGEGTG